MKKFTLFVCAIMIGAASIAQTTIPCPTSFKRSNGAGGGCGVARLTLTYAACPPSALNIDSVYYNGVKLDVGFLPGVISCSGSKFEVHYCVTTSNIPPTGFLTIYFQGNASYNGSVCTVTDGGGPLPITLSSFEASRRNGMVNLRWVTSSEVNAKEFILQRKTGSEFTDVATIAARNSSLSENVYTYADNNSSRSISEYRLKMVDLDGTFKYSATRSVNGISNDQEISVYPNPSKGNATVVVGENIRKANITLLDFAGRVVRNEKLVNNSSYTFTGLVPGMYLVKVTDPETNQTYKEKLSVIK